MKTKILFIVSMTFLFSCKKDEICDEPQLPCQTHEGKNTFGCLIDGVPFIAKTSFSIGGPVALSGSFDESTNLLKIQANRENSSEHLEKVNFQVYVSNIGTLLEMNVLIDDYDGYADYSGNKCEYYHDLGNKGSVNITFLDLEENIISGTFEMTLINPDCTDSTMAITEGRFDFGY